jgi:hypothetical protein
MSKQITASELAEITAKLLKGQELGPRTTEFMTDLAQLVCRYCGGVAVGPADNFAGELMVGIAFVKGMPEDGGIWKDYDEEGEL